MENGFRIKKNRDALSRPKHQEVVSGTLDSIHQGVVSSIRDTALNTAELRRTVEDYYREIGGAEASSALPDILRVSRLRSDIKEIEGRLRTEDPLKDYYLKNADIMLKYYGGGLVAPAVQAAATDQNTFMKYLAPSPAPVASGATKKGLFDEYTSRMKLNTGAEHLGQKTVSENCDTCNISRDEVPDQGVMVCPRCGSEEYMLVVSDFPSFRDPPKERNNYAYKKINHLNEILNQFQAKESTIIPDDVMNEVICEIKKRRIANIAELTEKDMREVLKKIGRSKYYEHATHILSRLNGNPPPIITPAIEEKVRTMFQEIQAPFLIYCPNDRTNFLSYSYILFKFFELLELDEYKVYFPLLKSRDRLIQHDQIWKKICDYLRWEFVPSV